MSKKWAWSECRTAHRRTVKAFVVLQPAPPLTRIRWSRGASTIWPATVPGKILFVDQLPRNVSGKLLRRSLV